MKVLMKGNEALAEAAIRAGCRHYFGYPITPQTEISAYMAKQMPKIGGTFLQAESEVAAINMVYGAAGAGVRVMTSSSSPGISLKQEGLSYIAACDLPCVIINIMRAGPGLGGILAAQSDYFQATKGGGHGDYHLIVLAPSSVQELIDITIKAFELADKYRNPVMILGDGILGQMMEPVEFDKIKIAPIPEKPWATNGTKMKRKKNIINSLNTNAEGLEKENIERHIKYKKIQKELQLVETYNIEDADIIFAAYGMSSRICKATIELLKEMKIKAGLIRPISLWPFPTKEFAKLTKVPILTVEMSHGQMVEDVRLSCPQHKVSFYGRSGGKVPVPADIAKEVQKILKKGVK